MAKHNCPDCGASHEMDTDGRIKRLEERVKELEARQPTCGHPHWWYTPTYYPTVISTPTYLPNSTTWKPGGPITVYSTSNSTLELT